MTPVDPSGNVAEVRRLGLVEGASVSRIARQLTMARTTVRKILGRPDVPRYPRLDLGEGNIRMVDDTRVAMRAWPGRDEAS